MIASTTPRLKASAALPSMAGRTVLQIIPALNSGGAERTVLEMAEAIIEAGGTALVACHGGRMISELEALGGEWLPLDARTKNPFKLRANANRLSAIIQTRSVDIVHARSRAPAWSAYWAAKRTHTRFVTTYHGAYSAGGPVKRWYNSVMARGDCVIANSQWIAAHIQSEHQVDKTRLVTIPRGVDLALFDPDQADVAAVEALRAAWGISRDKPEILLLLPGRMTRWKGQGLLLEALRRLAPDMLSGLRVVLLGDDQGHGNYAQELQAAMATPHLDGRVQIAPHRKDMSTAYAAADIVLAPSLRPEAFGRTAAEASAMAKPVIAADHGGARETVIEGETGFRFAPNGPDALAAAIHRVVQLSAEDRRALGEAGRRHIQAHFSKRGLQLATLQVYAHVLDPTRSHHP